MVPAQKPEGETRLTYEDGNGFNSRISNNDKLDKAKQVINDLEPYIVAYNENKLNLTTKTIQMASVRCSMEGRAKSDH